MTRSRTWVLAIVLSLSALGCSSPPILDLNPAELRERCARDLEAVRRYRKGLESVNEFVKSNPKVFPVTKTPGDQILGKKEREIVRETWKRLMDYQLALDSMNQFHCEWNYVDATWINKTIAETFGPRVWGCRSPGVYHSSERPKYDRKCGRPTFLG